MLTFEHVITELMPFIDTRFKLEIQLGTATMTIRELLDLDVGSLVELKKSAGEPMDVLCKGTPGDARRGDGAGGLPGPAHRGDHRLPPEGLEHGPVTDPNRFPPPPPLALCLGGLDPSGGAGLLRDVMTLAALGVHPMAVVHRRDGPERPGCLAIQPPRDPLPFLEALAPHLGRAPGA